MQTLAEQISQAGPEEIGDILTSALARYQELFPRWQISTLSLERSADKNDQLDRVIGLLTNMKE